MKTVLITGSSKGLGAALAVAFSKHQYAVILHGRNANDVSGIRRLLEKKGSTVYTVIGDLLEDKTIDEIVDCSIMNRVDIVVNNAGMYLNKSFSDMSMSEFKSIVDVNLIAPVAITHRIFNWFKKNKRGIIVNINSIAGKKGSDGEAAYCASKFGLRGFSESIQFEATRHGIRIFDVYLGAMKTEMTDNREGSELFMDTSEVSDIIVGLTKEFSSLRVNEISLSRIKY